MNNKVNHYWAALIAQIRTTQNWSQIEFAQQVASEQATVSRWERGLVLPQYDKQRLIESIAERINLASLQGIADVVNHSPFSMILTDQNHNVLAASKTSGFTVGLGVVEQTPLEEREYYFRFSESVTKSGFWNQSGLRFDYCFHANDHASYRAFVTSVVVRRTVYAVVQQIVEPVTTS